MDNKIMWLDEECWTSGATARDKEGKEVPFFNHNAVFFDLYGAIRVSYTEQEYFEVITKVKEIVKVLYSDLYESIEDKIYYKDKGKIIKPCPLYLINDSFTDFSQIRRILFYI